MKQKVGSLRGKEMLHVIVPINNYVRYESRYRLFEQFQEEMLANPNVQLWTVEVAFGDRRHEMTVADNPNHIQLRTHDELWHKENMINLAIARLPEDWEYVAWIDGDIRFISNLNWATETLHVLQHYKVCQLFQNAIDLGPNGETLQVHTGFAYAWINGAKNLPSLGHDPYYASNGYSGNNGCPFHPGFAWAARRDAINEMGGLFDISILGSGDFHMCMAWVGRVFDNIPEDYKTIGKTYMQKLLNYQNNCERFIKRNIGYIDGTVAHEFHGKKRDRQYQSRWSILSENKFDPDKHIKKDHQGLWQLDPDQIQLRDDIRRYFRNRLEDSVDTE